MTVAIVRIIFQICQNRTIKMGRMNFRDRGIKKVGDVNDNTTDR